jgi:Fe-S-cluster formation regulator IscX/YfhJ
MPESPVPAETNKTVLSGFQQYVTELKSAMKRHYDRGVNKDLSRQNWQDLFRRNITLTLKEVYDDSLARLQTLPLTIDNPQTDVEISELTAQTLNPFNGIIDELMQYALQKHRTSCALSNFPDEHKPSQEYIAEALQDAQRDWQEFNVKVNETLSHMPAPV